MRPCCLLAYTRMDHIEVQMTSLTMLREMTELVRKWTKVMQPTPKGPTRTLYLGLVGELER